jgi:NAD(P)-dependent dehydrogenase (short-subunit alcohol dehydrogenase family)
VLLSRLGAHLILGGRCEERLSKTRSLLEGSSHSVEPYNLEEIDGIPEWMKQVSARHGRLSGIVHSAGIHLTRPLRFQKPVDWDALMRVNVTAGMQLIKGLRQKGVVAESGAAVLISSVMGLAGQAAVGAYCASKGAIIALTRALALELAPERIRVNCVAPSVVQTDMAEKLKHELSPEHFAAIEKMHPLGIGSPDDVAHAVAFLLAETGRWITGTCLVVDGGYTAH